MSTNIFGLNIVNPDSHSLLTRKPARVGLFTFASDLGCQKALVKRRDLLEQALHMVDLVYWPMILDDDTDESDVEVDIAIVEGIVDAGDEQRLKGIRDRSRVMMALGTCTDIEDIVDVEYHVFGCPVSIEETIAVLQRVLLGEGAPRAGATLCASCVLAGNTCRLDEGKICLGPVTREGCSAVCISAGRPCLGCRGLADDANLTSARKIMEEHGSTDGAIDSYLGLFVPDALAKQADRKETQR